MTNTLTWDIRSIQVPKVNSNLLSVVSLVLLLTMAFLTASVIASHCEEIRNNLETSIAAEIIFAASARALFEVWKAACSSGNPWAIAAATAALGLATAAAAAALYAIAHYTTKLLECEQEHETASGGCDSGGCGSG